MPEKVIRVEKEMKIWTRNNKVEHRIELSNNFVGLCFHDVCHVYILIDDYEEKIKTGQVPGEESTEISFCIELFSLTNKSGRKEEEEEEENGRV